MARNARLASLIKSPDALKVHCEDLHRHYLELLGPLPEKTPLNPKITGVIECEDYRIEKVLFESRPNHFVTANIYIPTKGKPPFPGVAAVWSHPVGKAQASDSGNGSAFPPPIPSAQADDTGCPSGPVPIGTASARHCGA